MENNILTKKQNGILKIIENFIKKNGFSPTIRELCELAGLNSTSTIQGHINRLVEKGYIKNKRGCSRTIRILNKNI